MTGPFRTVEQERIIQSRVQERVQEILRERMGSLELNNAMLIAITESQSRDLEALKVKLTETEKRLQDAHVELRKMAAGPLSTDAQKTPDAA